MYRRRKRRRQRQQDDSDDEDGSMGLRRSIAKSCATSKLQRIIFVLIIAIVTDQLEWLLAIPPPIVPDYRFHPSNCGTDLTQGLQSEHLFRFSEEQLYILHEKLQMPAIMYTSERDKFWSIEGLCLVLRRLIFPLRYMDLVVLFGRQTGPLSRIFRHTMAWLYCKWNHLGDFNPARVINVNEFCAFTRSNIWNVICIHLLVACSIQICLLVGHQMSAKKCQTPSKMFGRLSMGQSDRLVNHARIHENFLLALPPVKYNKHSTVDTNVDTRLKDTLLLCQAGC